MNNEEGLYIISLPSPDLLSVRIPLACHKNQLDWGVTMDGAIKTEDPSHSSSCTIESLPAQRL